MCVLAVLAAGCASSERGEIDADVPPAPATWPRYPRFSEDSCWTRPAPATGVTRSAPSFASARGASSAYPSEIVRRLLARFSDRAYVRGIDIGAPPARSALKGFFPGQRPPSDGLWAYIDSPYAVGSPGPDSDAAEAARARAGWETELIGGALRDDFCSAGGRPLVGWSIGEQVRGVSDGTFALGQRFPNTSPKAFRARVSAIGERYGFRIASLILLRPRELAPLLVVETTRNRKAFVRDVPAIMSLLDPISNGRGQSAVTFEGFFFEARDAEGAFVRVENVYRGEIMGGQWSRSPCVYPYEHSEPVGAKPCPAD